MLHYTTLSCTTLHYTYNYNHNNNYATLHYTTLNHTTSHHPTLHYTRLDPLHLYKVNCKYTTLITLYHNHNPTTLQLPLRYHYTALHPAVVGEVTTATIATAPTNTNPTTFRSISGFALPSLIHNNQPLL